MADNSTSDAQNVDPQHYNDEVRVYLDVNIFVSYLARPESLDPALFDALKNYKQWRNDGKSVRLVSTNDALDHVLQVVCSTRDEMRLCPNSRELRNSGAAEVEVIRALIAEKGIRKSVANSVPYALTTAKRLKQTAGKISDPVVRSEKLEEANRLGTYAMIIDKFLIRHNRNLDRIHPNVLAKDRELTEALDYVANFARKDVDKLRKQFATLQPNERVEKNALHTIRSNEPYILDSKGNRDFEDEYRLAEAIGLGCTQLISYDETFRKTGAPKVKGLYFAHPKDFGLTDWQAFLAGQQFGVSNERGNSASRNIQTYLHRVGGLKPMFATDSGPRSIDPDVSEDRVFVVIRPLVSQDVDLKGFQGLGDVGYNTPVSVNLRFQKRDSTTPQPRISDQADNSMAAVDRIVEMAERSITELSLPIGELSILVDDRLSKSSEFSKMLEMGIEDRANDFAQLGIAVSKRNVTSCSHAAKTVFGIPNLVGPKPHHSVKEQVTTTRGRS